MSIDGHSDRSVLIKNNGGRANLNGNELGWCSDGVCFSMLFGNWIVFWLNNKRENTHMYRFNLKFVGL